MTSHDHVTVPARAGGGPELPVAGLPPTRRGLVSGLVATAPVRRTVRRLVPRRLQVQVVLDCCAWAVALTFATMVRYDFAVDRVDWSGLVRLLPLVALAQAVAGLVFGLYLGRWRFGSFEELAGLGKACVLATAVVFSADKWVGSPRLVPLSAVLAGGMVAIVVMGGVRYFWRLTLDIARQPVGHSAERVLVFGAGEGGAQAVAAMLSDPASPYLPVALLDDDVAKRNLRVRHVPVIGTRERLAEAAADTRATTVLVAIPSAGSGLVMDISERATEAGLTVKVLPRVAELIGGAVHVVDIRDPSPADLLGRHEIRTDVETIAGYLAGKRVLVTGAGGSIGSELCRQIYRFAPAELMMLDRDESALHAVQLSIHGRALLDSDDVLLASIRDIDALDRIFAERRPQVVFHAAALKHLPMLEQYPDEGVKTNVYGTLNVLEASARHGVERLVNISTDKAADPISVLGYTKRIAERLTAWFGENHDGTYLSVRFGNVLGSRGSVLTAFQAQIAAGGPVTVTHPDVTRYFMTVEEAVELVIQAGAIGSSGEALVLDMGAPVRIADVARVLAARAGRPIDIVYTGLRAGEKLHEALFGADEIGTCPAHPLIAHVPVQALAPEHAPEVGDADAVARLATGAGALR